MWTNPVAKDGKDPKISNVPGTVTAVVSQLCDTIRSCNLRFYCCGPCRIYPPQFCREMVEMLGPSRDMARPLIEAHGLLRGRHACDCFQVTETERQQPLPEFFANLSWEENNWTEIELRPVVYYLRCSKHIKVPREFKQLIPKTDPDPSL